MSRKKAYKDICEKDDVTAYTVHDKACAGCKYYAFLTCKGNTHYCSYYAVTGKHRNESEPVIKCSVKDIGDHVYPRSSFSVQREADIKRCLARKEKQEAKRNEPNG